MQYEYLTPWAGELPISSVMSSREKRRAYVVVLSGGRHRISFTQMEWDKYEDDTTRREAARDFAFACAQMLDVT